ncbi:MAG: hypothetical protein M1823_000033 [Watsoniomyces obsoletus]|nr:MAG: hypothetical protein M1823_000033 [Watsoniomyces obsoletus]
MARIQPAEASNNISRKRKRKTPAEGQNTPAANEPAIQTGDQIETSTSTTTTVPTKTTDGGTKVRRTKKADSGTAPSLRRASSSTSIVTSNIPWPEHFKSLARTHRALNLVFTFCCTRKHLATTFDNIKKAVEAHIKQELKEEDVAQTKALVPRAINFAYVEEAMLQVHVSGEDHARKNKNKEVYGFVQEKHGNEDGPSGFTPSGELLLFEFIDGDLKREVQHAKTGEPTRPVRKLKDEELKMPVYSQKQMTTLINKRNTKFDSAVNAFLNQCELDNVDPVETLKTAGEAFMPIPGRSRSATPGLSKPSVVHPPPTIPEQRKSIPEIIAEIKTTEWYTGQIVPDGHRVFDPQSAIYGELNFELSQNMVNALYNTRNISQLYSHQAEAINNLYDGHHVIVSTSTSSGKSLIYQIPVLHALEKDSSTRAMYIFPTKALAQDQRRSLKELLKFMSGLEETVVETFDGDTPMSERNYIRDEARIIFTNPDMLHITILPQEEAWRTFLKHLRYVVVDELHVYNSLFGSHVAFIMRRLRRICAAVGNRHVQFISCSATVANPEEVSFANAHPFLRLLILIPYQHMKTIFGVDDVRLTDFDGSPSGRKEFICWNTPFKDPSDPSSGRGDTFTESAKLFCQLILRGVRVIAFCRIRRQCEILVNTVKAELTNLGRGEVGARVMGYRGGYTAQDRRKIEREMFEGKLMGVIATNALELGVDIGSLDAVITVGFPYTVSNLRQQSGRAGRRNQDSLSVLIGASFPTDQYYMDNPSEIFTRPNCELQVDLENELVLEGHIQCAAYEMPIRPCDDAIYFGPQLFTIARERMIRDQMGYFHCNERFRPYPSKHVAIRDTEEGHFAIVDMTNQRNVVLEEVEPSRAFFTIYEGGIFLHQGRTYLVREFCVDRRLAKVELVNVDWITQQRDYTDIDPIETESIRRIRGSLSRAFFGPIKITAVVFGYFKLDRRRRILDAVNVDNPPIIIFSKGMWLDVPKHALDILNSHRLNLAGAIHAAEHALLSLMPHFVISMPGDVRTECKHGKKELAKRETKRKRPARLTFYDTKGGAGGSGIAAKAFEFVDNLLEKACERIAKCCCTTPEGCVECVCSEGCGGENVVMSKAGGEVILKCLLGRHVDVDALPYGEEETVPGGIIETVVLAEEIGPRRGLAVKEVDIKEEGDDDDGGNGDGGVGGNEDEEEERREVVVKDEDVE